MNYKTIICTVTNDLNQDQRMTRICTTLSEMGYDVLLVGRQKRNSLPLTQRPFRQKRLFCFFEKGFLFYAEYNLRLFTFLNFQKVHLLYAVDLDTILPVCLQSKLFRKKFVFDAHEYFTEVPELENRIFVKKVWTKIAGFCIPGSNLAITVNESLSELFKTLYHTPFRVLYNVPILENDLDKPNVTISKTLLYQGVLNKGRGLEQLIDAMPFLPEFQLIVIGEGDYSQKLKTRADRSLASDRIIFKGWLFNKELKRETEMATIGINILDGKSLNYQYSLANKFFDYIHAGLPSINMDFPEYKNIIKKYKVGKTIPNIEVQTLVDTIQQMSVHENTYLEMKLACKQAKLHFNWQFEEKKLMEWMKTLEQN